ncbi:MAG: hypothetical protein RI885_1100 [Actinomycetota bacterium]
MKRTSYSALVLIGVVGGAVSGLLQLALATSGRPVIVLPITLPLALAAIGAVVIVLAVPIRRMTRGRSSGPVDPFFATRVVMLAKASAIGGALVTGVGAGMLVYLLTRSVVPGVGSIGSSIAAIVGAVALLACGLIAEHMCRIPPGDDDDDDDDDQRPIRIRP